jgi:hypothetical protein
LANIFVSFARHFTDFCEHRGDVGGFFHGRHASSNISRSLRPTLCVRFPQLILKFGGDLRAVAGFDNKFAPITAISEELRSDALVPHDGKFQVTIGFLSLPAFQRVEGADKGSVDA